MSTDDKSKKKADPRDVPLGTGMAQSAADKLAERKRRQEERLGKLRKQTGMK